MLNILSNAKQVKILLDRDFANFDMDVMESVQMVTGAIMYELTTDPPEGTPQDTRRAVNGWNASNGSIPDFKDDGQGIYSDPNPTAEALKVPLGSDESNIANGVPYIGKLENGSSKQSPNNYVRIAIQRALIDMKGTKLGSKSKNGKKAIL